MRTRIATSELPTQHVVRSGETLRSVSRRYHVRVKDLAYANNLSPRERLTPGLSLIIPKKGRHVATGKVQHVRRTVSMADKPGKFITHVVKRGESLWSISEKYNVTVQDLFRWNKLHRSRLKPGRRLKVKLKKGANDNEAE
jgi:membrane-bound lytic murein transglycosylase D